MTERKKLSKADIIKSWVLWFFFSHASYNYERLQANAFAHSMIPILKKLYSSKEEMSEALKRHLVFFNTEPNVGSVIHGITIAMEEEKANGAEISSDSINSIKTGLMGPVAGIGDAVVQGVILPILLAFGIGLGKEGNLMGPILYTILITVIITGISYSTWMQGYKTGNKAVEKFLKSGSLDKFLDAAKILGCTVIGALTAQFVNLKAALVLNVGKTSVNIQTDVIDKIMPNLLPLLLTLGVLGLLKKGKNPLTIMLYLMIFGALGSIVGLF